MNNGQSHPSVHRYFEGAPILAPTELGWENGVTFNAAVTYLPQTLENQPLLVRLLSGTVYHDKGARDGLIAVHYRARPRSDPGYLITRSSVGLALFTPDMELIYRFPEPVLKPGSAISALDYLGVEDPRVTEIDGRFTAVYCGSGQDAGGRWVGTLCTAESSDLLNWEKRGAILLDIPVPNGTPDFDDTYFDNSDCAHGAQGRVNNKDGVLFPKQINGKCYLLHRPMTGRISQWAMHLATAEKINGQWRDLGPILHGAPRAGWANAWVGAGAVPIDLGNGRWLEIFHSGHRAADRSRFYTLGAVVLNFNHFDPADPSTLVESRLDHFMVPETKWELQGPYPDSVGNVLFTCGAYERNGEINIIYGGGDTYLMAAKVRKSELLASLIPARQPARHPA